MICPLMEIIGHLDELQHCIDNRPQHHDAGMAGNLTRISAMLDLLGDCDSGDVAARAADKALGIPFQAIHNKDAEEEFRGVM